MSPPEAMGKYRWRHWVFYGRPTRWRAEQLAGRRGTAHGGQQRRCCRRRSHMHDAWRWRGGTGSPFRGRPSSPEEKTEAVAARRGVEGKGGATRRGMGPGGVKGAYRHANRRRGRPVGEKTHGGAEPPGFQRNWR